MLEFPAPGLDDPAAYQGYRTRIFRDTRGNAVQVYLAQRSGRVVVLWADALDESAAFTARDTTGAPAAFVWGTRPAESSQDPPSAGGRRSLTFRLRLPGEPLALGHFALGSMRWERDLQYQERHLASLDSTLPPVPEEAELVRRLGRLEPAERARQLALLGAASVEALRTRLTPTLALITTDSLWTARIERPSLDGRHRLVLEIVGERAGCVVERRRYGLLVRPRAGHTFSLAVRVRTDGPPLTPIARAGIFAPKFLRYYERLRREQAESPRFRRLDREVRGMELVSYEEKLMAGLPNFATYFGRDMMTAALMLEPIWQPAMLEHVIAGVLAKLSPAGEASHEEALGGQAIREHAAEYSALLARADSTTATGRDSLLARARATLAHLDRTRESYTMVDESLQLPVVAARYLAHPGVPAEAKRRFLLAPARAGDAAGGPTRLEALLSNFAFVADQAAPYARSPQPTALVSFPPADGGGWRSASWRDSRVGYAGGRFAMDVNVVWMPLALEAIESTRAAVTALGFPAETLLAIAHRHGRGALEDHLRDPGGLARERWRDAWRWFEVRLAAPEARTRIAAWLAWLPEPERGYWRAVADSAALPDTLRFLALSLDEKGQPIPVMNTDPASLLFLDADAPDPARALRWIEPLMIPYPVGLFVPALGPVVANDAYASREVWEAFRADRYHSPSVVWGREVELLVLGIERQIDATGASPDEASRLRRDLGRLRAAVEASGFAHAELWSYRIERDALRPERFGTGSDVQLWSLTDLAVQFALGGEGQREGEGERDVQAEGKTP